MVPRPRDRMELRQTLRQPVLAEGPRAGRAVPSLQGLERLRRSSPAGVPVRTLETGSAVPGRWSVCAAKQEKYYGFKAGMLMNSAGEIFRWGPANTDEREMLGASAIPVR